MDDFNRVQPFALNSANTVNATLVNAGRCALTSIACSNIGAAAASVKLYDKAVAPTVGTDVPKLTIQIPAEGLITLDVPLLFMLGFGFGITNLDTDADTTAVAAAQVKVFGTYQT